MIRSRSSQGESYKKVSMRDLNSNLDEFSGQKTNCKILPTVKIGNLGGDQLLFKNGIKTLIRSSNL